jgi:hypothetical protein
MHWSEMPAHFERLRDRMKESGSLVFRDLDFMGLFFALTLFRRVDVLAEKLVPWEPMDREERLALLAKRTGATAWSSLPCPHSDESGDRTISRAI